MKNDKNVWKSIRVVLFVAVTASAIVATQPVQADDYYNYGGWNPGIGHTTGVAGYVDTAGIIEGVAGGEYLFVTGGPSYAGQHYAYTYRVETTGDENLHPSNPEATGPISPRTFTQVGSRYAMGPISSGHENAFYVNDNGIYYGADDFGITHWDFGWSNRTVIGPTTPGTTQTFGYDESTGNFWAGGSAREMYMYDPGNPGPGWVYQGTHKFLGGGHHDGMEVINGSLFVSDMTSDIIAQYKLDGSIDWANPDNEFSYSESAYVEGMGYGPNSHLWISGWNSGSIYEIGGGVLQHELVPVPGAFLLGSIGLCVANWRLRRRKEC